MNKIDKKKKKGITLIETLLYLSLFGMFFVTILEYVFAITEFNRFADQRNEIQKNVIYLDQHLKDSFVVADSIDTGQTTFSNNSGKLRLTTTGGAFYEYNIVNQRLQFNKNGTLFFLTKPEHIISRFNLEPVTNAEGTTVAVKVIIDLAYNKKTDLFESMESLYTL